jgi:crotonobetainyl-CoA:carnitine CoA-transferase CaiB-like acyl-CoA transferase
MSEILKGIRILEVSNFVSGPWACQMLAEYGAEVIKIESPKGGDPFRSFSENQYSGPFCAHNSHKKSVSIDLSSAGGTDVFRRLAKTADVVVENFRPGVLDRLGIGWDDLRRINPSLIYCAISGFGPSGPYKHRPAYDTVIQAVSGLLGQFLAPDNARIAGPNVADSVTSLCAVSGVLGALYARERSGSGARIDVPMLDAVIAFATNPIGQYFTTGRTPDPYQRPSQSQCFVFKCADGRMISIHMSAPQKFWEGMLKTIGYLELDADPRFNSNRNRIRNFEELGQVLAPYFLTKTRSEWESLLEQNDVPYAPVNDFKDVENDPQVRHLKTIMTTTHPQMGLQKCISRPVYYNGSREFTAAAPPILGEHTDVVLSEVGFSNNEIAELRAQGAIK